MPKGLVLATGCCGWGKRLWVIQYRGATGHYLVDVAGFGDSVRFETLAGVEIRRAALLW